MVGFNMVINCFEMVYDLHLIHNFHLPSQMFKPFDLFQIQQRDIPICKIHPNILPGIHILLMFNTLF